MRNLFHRAPRLIGLALFGLPLAGCGNYAPSVAWSPDGKTLATDWKGNLRLMDAEIGAQYVLGTPGRQVFSPAFSPDGKMLAYYAVREDKDESAACDVWVCYLSTRKEVRLAERVVSWPSDASERSTSKARADWAAGFIPFGPGLSWRPDSRALACVMQGESENSSQIAIIDLPTGATSRLGHPKAESLCPNWSPNGGQLSFFSFHVPGGGGSRGMQLHATFGNDPVTLLLHEAPEPSVGGAFFWPLGWSTNGQSIYALEQKGSSPPVFLQDVSLTRLPTRTLGNVEQAGLPVCRVGGQMAYVSSGERKSVILMSDATTTPRVLSKLPAGAWETSAVLSPRGDRVAVPVCTTPNDPESTSTFSEIRIWDVATGRCVTHPLTNEFPILPLEPASVEWLRNQTGADARRAWVAQFGLTGFLALGLGLTGLAVLSRISLRVLIQLLARE